MRGYKALKREDCRGDSMSCPNNKQNILTLSSFNKIFFSITKILRLAVCRSKRR